MGLRHYDGTPKPALAIWQEALARPYQAGARRDPTSPVLAADSIPRVQRTAPVSAPGTELDTAMLNPSPADFRVPGSVVVLAPLPAGTVITVRPIIGRALGTWSTSGTEWRWDGSLPDGKNIRSGLYKIIPTTPSGETRTILLKIQ